MKTHPTFITHALPTARTPSVRLRTPTCTQQAPRTGSDVAVELYAKRAMIALAVSLATLVPWGPEMQMVAPGLAEGGESADVRPQLKISGGSASTMGGVGGQKTVTKTVTRGITLESADFSNSDFEGVSFQQSILRNANFANTILRNASFFDADLTGVNFTNADMAGVNLELANARQVNFTGANLTGAYISSTTKLNGAVIENSDWTDTLLRKDQQAFLCSMAKGTNPITGVETRESLFCPE